MKYRSSKLAAKTVKNVLKDENLFLVADEPGEVIGKYSRIVDKEKGSVVKSGEDRLKRRYESNKNLSREFIKTLKKKSILFRHPINLTGDLLPFLESLPVHVNSGDYVWFDLVVSSKDHIVVSEDSDFIGNSEELGNRYGIIVYSLADFVSRFCVN